MCVNKMSIDNISVDVMPVERMHKYKISVEEMSVD